MIKYLTYILTIFFMCIIAAAALALLWINIDKIPAVEKTETHFENNYQLDDLLYENEPI